MTRLVRHAWLAHVVVSMFWVGIVISYGSDCSRSNHSMMMPVLQQQSTQH